MAHACINSCTIPGLSYPITIEYYYPTKKYQIKTKERVLHMIYFVFFHKVIKIYTTHHEHTLQAMK